MKTPYRMICLNVCMIPDQKAKKAELIKALCITRVIIINLILSVPGVQDTVLKWGTKILLIHIQNQPPEFFL